MFHGRPYGIGAGPAMEEGSSANASQLRSLTIDFTLIYFIWYEIWDILKSFHFSSPLLDLPSQLYMTRWLTKILWSLLL